MNITPGILVIDSNVNNLISLKAILQKAIPSCEVMTASFGEEGIEKAKKDLPDVILLDFKIQEEDGFKICKRLKSNKEINHILIILVSSIFEDSENSFEDLRLYTDAFFTKPISEAELCAQINLMLRIKNAEVQIKKEGSKKQKEHEYKYEMGFRGGEDLDQMLAALKTDLHWLKKKLPAESKDEHKKIDSMFELMKPKNHDVQKVTTKLKPSNLYVLEFIPTLKWYAEEFQNRTGINCKTHFVPKEIHIDKNLSALLFGIFDEILSNVEKHANASSVKITVNFRNDRLMMKINDNGIGIMEEKVNDPRSFGLIGIRERVRMHNGNIVIRGFTGRGTKVIIIIPLKK